MSLNLRCSTWCCSVERSADSCATATATQYHSLKWRWLLRVPASTCSAAQIVWACINSLVYRLDRLRYRHSYPRIKPLPRLTEPYRPMDKRSEERRVGKECRSGRAPYH